MDAVILPFPDILIPWAGWGVWHTRWGYIWNMSSSCLLNPCVEEADPDSLTLGIWTCLCKLLCVSAPGSGWLASGAWLDIGQLPVWGQVYSSPAFITLSKLCTYNFTMHCICQETNSAIDDIRLQCALQCAVGLVREWSTLPWYSQLNSKNQITIYSLVFTPKIYCHPKKKY